MQTKLTLRLDATLIEQAKAFAAQHDRSVSQLVADYFAALANGREEARSATLATPVTDSLVGLLRKAPRVARQETPHDPYFEHIKAKHLHDRAA